MESVEKPRGLSDRSLKEKSQANKQNPPTLTNMRLLERMRKEWFMIGIVLAIMRLAEGAVHRGEWG